MNSNRTTNNSNETSLRKAALIAGLGILVMVLVGPFAEFYAYGSLINWGDAMTTADNIRNNQSLFLIGIICYLIMFSCDFLVAWALYILLKPTSRFLSLLTAWFRLIYGVLTIVALTNVFRVPDLINPSGYFATWSQEELNNLIMWSVNSFSTGSNVAFLFFSSHLIVLGYLVFKSGYIPRIFGFLLIINGLGYLMEYFIAPFILPRVDTGNILMITFFGEIIFMIWLLIKGFNPKQTFSQIKPRLL